MIEVGCIYTVVSGQKEVGGGSSEQEGLGVGSPLQRGPGAEPRWGLGANSPDAGDIC